jgi:hypothetical protein
MIQQEQIEKMREQFMGKRISVETEKGEKMGRNLSVLGV